MKILNIDPVLIVGAGPAGMTAALELSRLGIPLRIVDKVVEPPTTSRAVGVQARTLELFEQRGLAKKLIEAGNPAEAASAWGGGKRVFRLEFSRIDSRYNYLLFVSQAVTENVLRDAIEEQGVPIERGVTLVAIGQPERHAEINATLEHRDGSIEEVRASYLIDAEGAHSTVRTTLNLDFHGKALDENYALGDLHVDSELPEHDFHIFSSDGGFMGMFPMGNHRWRLIASNPISKPSKDTEPSIEELQEIYDQRSPIAARFHDMSWSSWFKINSRMIDTMQVNRVFFCGDAAHIHSPAGAQGMNTGIQDAIDLCWKLALVLKGVASTELLQTYNEDRLPVIHDVLTKTEGLTEIIGSENAFVRSAFNLIAPWVTGFDFVQDTSTTRMSQIGLHYRKSSLSETHAHGGNLNGGDRVPDMTVEVLSKPDEASKTTSPKRVYELLSPNKFTLLLANIANPERVHREISEQLEPWHEHIEGIQIATSATKDEAEHFANTFGKTASIILVRPDAYVGWIGDDGDVSKLVKYLSKWLTINAAPDTGGGKAGVHFQEG